MTELGTGLLATLLPIFLSLLRLAVFGLALGLTLISFQAYSARGSKRLESAFIGFAFISMGVALTSLRTQISGYQTAFQIVETIPFVIGFSMLYLSLYR